METLQKKDRNRGIIATVIFHFLLLLCLIFLGLRTPLPLPEEEGIEIRLGTLDGMGDISFTPPPQHVASANNPRSSDAQEELMTQNTDEVPAINTSRQRPERPQTNETQTTVTETTTPVRQEPTVNQNYLFTGTQAGSNQGETNNPGFQGSTQGNPNASSHQGGQGGGVSFTLEGRSSRNLPRPEYNSPEQGTVVVSIVVDRNGRVTKAIPGAQGSTTNDPTLRNLAQQAALRATFDAKPDAPEEQFGTITYRFIRLN